METTAIRPDTAQDERRLWGRIWPAGLAVLVAAGTAYGLHDARDAAPVVAASGLVYLAAAAVGRPRAAWIAFAVTFVLIGLDSFAGLNSVPWLLALAAVLILVGVAGRRGRPVWSFPLQTGAMLLLAAVALVAILFDERIGGLLVAVALLAHAGWDIYHHRTGRVVDRSLAEFCAVLDVLVAVFVAAVAVTS